MLFRQSTLPLTSALCYATSTCRPLSARAAEHSQPARYALPPSYVPLRSPSIPRWSSTTPGRTRSSAARYGADRRRRALDLPDGHRLGVAVLQLVHAAMVIAGGALRDHPRLSAQASPHPETRGRSGTGRSATSPETPRDGAPSTWRLLAAPRGATGWPKLTRAASRFRSTTLRLVVLTSRPRPRNTTTARRQIPRRASTPGHARRCPPSSRALSSVRWGSRSTYSKPVRAIRCCAACSHSREFADSRFNCRTALSSVKLFTSTTVKSPPASQASRMQSLTSSSQRMQTCSYRCLSQHILQRL